MVNDVFVQQVPALGDIKVEDGIIYFKNGCQMKDSLNPAVLGANVILEFINIENESKFRLFVSKYGLLEKPQVSAEHYKVKKAKKITGYHPVAAIKEFLELQSDLRGFLDIIPEMHKVLKNKKFDNDFRKEEVEPLLYDFINELNGYVRARKISISYLSDKNIFQTEIYYMSLRHLLYCKMAEVVTGSSIPKRCEKCNDHWILSSKSNVKYCTKCKKTASKQKTRENKKNDIKEQVYLGVYGHINTKAQRGVDFSPYIIDRDNFDYQRFIDKALKIKRESTDFFHDLDELCKSVCMCRKCQSGLATFYKTKYERKQGSPE